MARELHDGPIRELTTCIVRLEGFRLANRNPEMQLAISAVEEHARAALLALRRTISELRDEPPEEDVASAVLAMVGRYRDLSSAQLSVVISPTWPDLLPGSTALNVLRIIQEAVNNAVMHSGAKEILIELKSDSGRLGVAVSDDGGGIPATAPEGTGISGMRERAALLGGALTVSRRHPGTLVRLQVPIG